MKRDRIDLVRIAAILVIFLGVAYFYLNIFSPLSIPRSLRIGLIRRPYNILIVGSDITYNAETRKPEPDRNGRADTILLARIDPIKYQINTISIPRDTFVNIPGYGPSKINVANAFGGIAFTHQVVEALLGTQIDYYIEIKPNAIPALVDNLGGITIDIEQDMRYVDHASNLDIDLKKGKQALSGKQAHHYIRFRERIYGDIGRIKRQQKFLKALGRSFTHPANVFKAPFAISATLREIKTNLPLSNIIRTLNLFRFFSMGKIKTNMAPGESSYVRGAGSVWLLNRAELEEMMGEFF